MKFLKLLSICAMVLGIGALSLSAHAASTGYGLSGICPNVVGNLSDLNAFESGIASDCNQLITVDTDGVATHLYTSGNASPYGTPPSLVLSGFNFSNIGVDPDGAGPANNITSYHNILPGGAIGDDVLIGVLNLSSTPLNGIYITAAAGVFAFDTGTLADGICHFTTGALACSNGYRGLNTTFTDVTDGTTPPGDKTYYMSFNTPLGLNGHTFFSLEDKLTGEATIAVPEPETYALMLAGLGLMGFVSRRRKQRAA